MRPNCQKCRELGASPATPMRQKNMAALLIILCIDIPFYFTRLRNCGRQSNFGCNTTHQFIRGRPTILVHEPFTSATKKSPNALNGAGPALSIGSPVCVAAKYVLGKIVHSHLTAGKKQTSLGFAAEIIIEQPVYTVCGCPAKRNSISRSFLLSLGFAHYLALLGPPQPYRPLLRCRGQLANLAFGVISSLGNAFLGKLVWQSLKTSHAFWLAARMVKAGVFPLLQFLARGQGGRYNCIFPSLQGCLKILPAGG